MVPSEILGKIIASGNEDEILNFCRDPKIFEFCKENKEIISRRLVLLYLPNFKNLQNSRWSTLWKQIYPYRRVIKDDLNDALVYLIPTNNVDLIEYFIKKGAIKKLEQALYFANTTKMIDYLLSKASFNNETRLDVLNTSLEYAASRNDIVIVKHLVKLGANSLDLALLEATLMGYLEIVKFLVDSGANNLEDALEIAKEQNYKDIIKFLEAHSV